MDDRVAQARNSQMYVGRDGVATTAATPSVRHRILLAAEGAALGVAFWVLLLTLGVPWVFHIGGFDGLLPSAIIGAVLAWAGWRAVPMAIVGLLSLVLIVVAYTPIIVAPAQAFIRDDPLPAKADAIMVLSAGLNDDGTISPEATDRLIKGLELLNRGVAPLLVVSRESYLVDGKIVTSRQDQERIVSLSPGALSKLVVAGVTHSTHDEAVRAGALSRSRGWTRIIVVTSPMHTRRACATFETAGVKVSCVASNARALAIGMIASPTDRVRAFQAWLYEIAGSIRYRQLGWL